MAVHAGQRGSGEPARPAGLGRADDPWRGPLVAAQAEPGAGAWPTWAIASGGQLRLPPPPDRRRPAPRSASWRRSPPSATPPRSTASATGTPARPATAGTTWPSSYLLAKRGSACHAPRACWRCSTSPSTTRRWPPGTPSTPTTAPGRPPSSPAWRPPCRPRPARPTRPSTPSRPAPPRPC